MGSFEWMELQTLNAEITDARSRLSSARSNKDNRLARMLEEEIAAAERRRARLLAHITTQLASTGEAALHPELLEGAVSDMTATAESTTEQDPGSDEVAEPVTLEEELSTVPVPQGKRSEGDTAVWEQLTPDDIERAKTELGVRRAEILARHAEELKGLDADQTQLDQLEEAIAAFARKFSLSQGKGAVVHLDEQRESRLQSHG